MVASRAAQGFDFSRVSRRSLPRSVSLSAHATRRAATRARMRSSLEPVENARAIHPSRARIRQFAKRDAWQSPRLGMRHKKATYAHDKAVASSTRLR
jgi:hypothetical protein